jgi:formate dehydrogenase alpha subunit
VLHLQVLDGRVEGVVPDRTHPVSQGQLCIKGWTANDFVTHNERLTVPLIRKNGKLTEASWDEALSLVAAQFSRHPPTQIGALASAKVTNEDNYIMQKFARVVLHTNNVDHCARLCHASTVVGLVKSFGSGAMTNSIPDLADSKCFLIIGSNTTENHPLVAKFIMKARENGARLIVADPRAIPWVQFADIHLPQRPGTDVALLNGLMHVILAEELEDKAFVEARTEGFDEMKALLADYTPQHVSQITGIPADDIVRAARMYAESDASAVVYSMGITQHTTGVDNVVSIANLAMLTGNIGRPGTGVNALRGQVNVQGACDMGALPNVFPGYQAVIDEALRKKFQDKWNVELPAQPGWTVTEMIDQGAKGALKALYIMGENPMVSDPDLCHVEEGLRNIEFLVVQDIFLTETAALAHVVLPAASYAEQEGTYTSTDRRVQWAPKAMEPVGSCRADWEIIGDLARRMGSKEFPHSSAAEIMDEVASLTPIYGGMSYDRLREGDLQWPCPAKDHPGTPILHKEKFSRGLGKFWPIPFKEPAELPDDEYPLILTTGRVIFHFHTGTMSRKSELLNKEVPTGYVEIHPSDAARRSITEGETVRVATRRGSIQIPVRITDRVKLGVVFIPFHFAECAANVLTNPAVDPVAKIPEFKACACTIDKA